ncbi:MAG: endonuclease/exonuclease/phosphatase family protein [Rhodobacteraceae bacterium]|nr:endonuclease/exonuclease/phosphatase family protein [Paracoccaceae bacterium]
MLWIIFSVLALPFVLVGCQQGRLSPSTDLPARDPEAIRFATWNVHYIWLEQQEGRWGLSGWEDRKAPMDATLKALEADIIGFQEMESFSRRGDGNVNLKREYLLEQNPQFAAAATGRAEVFPPTQPIFYRPDRFTLIDEGWFFFSETPDVIYSRGFDGASPSFANWAVFETNGTQFRVVNIHPDAFSRTNRQASMKLVAERIKPWLEAGETLVLLGDFNARHGSGFHQVFEAMGLTFPKPPGATYHLDRGLHLFGAIDHIGISPGLSSGKATVFNRKLGEVWPSDHHPVVLDVTPFA